MKGPEVDDALDSRVALRTTAVPKNRAADVSGTMFDNPARLHLETLPEASTFTSTTSADRSDPVRPTEARRTARWLPSLLAALLRPMRGGLREEVVVKAAESALRMLLGLAATSFVVRRLGVDAFGSFSYVWSIYAIATPLASLGIDQVILRAICSDPARTPVYVSQAIRLRGYGALGAASLLLISLAAGQATSEEMVVGLIASTGLAFLLSEISMAVLQAERGSKHVAQLRLFAFAVSGACKITAAVVHPTPATIALATVMEPAMLLLLTRLLSRRASLPRRPLPYTAPVAPGSSLLRQGFPYLLSAASVALYMRCDVVMLHRWSSPTETGLYAAVTRISEVMYFLPVAVCAAATPGLLRLFQVDPRQCLDRLRRLTVMLCGVAIAFAVSTAVLAPILLQLAFGREYSAATPVLRIHALSTIPVFVGVAREIWLLAHNQGRVSLATTVSGAALNIGLNMLLIPRSGALGAAVSTTVSYTFAVFVAPLAFSSGREFFGIGREKREGT